MRKINIKDLKDNLSKELKDLPFEITYYGKTIATVGKVATFNDKDKENSKKVATLSENNTKKVATFNKDKYDRGKFKTYFKK